MNNYLREDIKRLSGILEEGIFTSKKKKAKLEEKAKKEELLKKAKSRVTIWATVFARENKDTETYDNMKLLEKNWNRVESKARKEAKDIKNGSKRNPYEKMDGMTLKELMEPLTENEIFEMIKDKFYSVVFTDREAAYKRNKYGHGVY